MIPKSYIMARFLLFQAQSACIKEGLGPQNPEIKPPPDQKGGVE